MFGFGRKIESSGGAAHDLLLAALQSTKIAFFVNCLAPEREGLVYVNDSLLSYLGYSSFDEVRGRHVGTFFAPTQEEGRSVPEFVELVESSIKATGYWSGVAYYMRADGSVFVTFGNVSVFEWQGLPYAVVVIEDFAKNTVEQRRRQQQAALAATFQQQIGTVSKAVAGTADRLSETAKVLEEAAKNTSRETATLSLVAERTSGNVQMVVAATGQLSGSIGEISGQVQHSSGIAGAALTQAESTGRAVAELAEAAARIGDVIKLIRDIAAQTNLLALNATIEAARAGDAGKGFAVVANEVKALANQTARATEEIGTQVSGIQSATNQTVAAIRAIGDTIREVNATSTAIAAAVDEQAAATRDISNAVAEASAGMQTIGAGILAVTAAADQTESASQLVAREADELSRHSDSLGLHVEGFLVTLNKG